MRKTNNQDNQIKIHYKYRPIINKIDLLIINKIQLLIINKIKLF
jgi:hypothetical protein